MLPLEGLESTLSLARPAARSGGVLRRLCHPSPRAFERAAPCAMWALEINAEGEAYRLVASTLLPRALISALRSERACPPSEPRKTCARCDDDVACPYCGGIPSGHPWPQTCIANN